MGEVDALLHQTRQPQFISTAYFIRFKFDAGTYALAGREKFEGSDVLRIEYYPTKLFTPNKRRDDNEEESGGKRAKRDGGSHGC